MYCNSSPVYWPLYRGDVIMAEKFTQLTLEDRVTIQSALAAKESFASICILRCNENSVPLHTEHCSVFDGTLFRS